MVAVIVIIILKIIVNEQDPFNSDDNTHSDDDENDGDSVKDNGYDDGQTGDEDIDYKSDNYYSDYDRKNTSCDNVYDGNKKITIINNTVTPDNFCGSLLGFGGCVDTQIY